MPDNKQILNDVRTLRKRADDSQYRNYSFRAKSDHIRVVFEDDVAIPNTAPFAELRDLGYEFAGVNFQSKMVAFDPVDE